MAQQERGRSVSIKDVARVAGVSHQTVSRVLNQPETVREKTLKAVEEAIRLTGYHRNQYARALKSNKAKIIGVLLPNTGSSGPSSVLWAIERAVANTDYMLQIVFLNGQGRQSVAEAAGRLLGYGVSVVIVLATQTWVEPTIKLAVDMPIVEVGVSESVRTDGVSVIDYGERDGVEAAIRHLAEQGVQRVDHVSGVRGWISTELRIEAWNEAQSRFGLRAGRLYEGGWDGRSGYEAGMKIADNFADDVSYGILAANDHVAVGVIRALHDRGFAVPDDVRVVGYDNTDMGEFSLPTLTTVDQGLDEVGKTAVSMAIDMVQGGGSAARVAHTHPRLIVRESSVISS